MTSARNLPWAALTVRMLRYRVALMLWMFLLLGAASQGSLDGSSWWRLALAGGAVAASYVSATSINDVADRDIDRMNHPGDPGRPLVTGEAQPRDLVRLHWLAAVAAALLGGLLGPAGAAVVAAGLIVGHAYSAGPVPLSSRTYLAPLFLGVGYVVVPVALGIVAAGGPIRDEDVLLAAGLWLLFLARIVLKDFRDRDGDAAHGRRTVLLVHGRRVTCSVSLAALAAGVVVVLAALRPPVPYVAAVAVLGTGIVSRLWRLSRASDRAEEQAAIGLGARLGNGILILLVGWLLLAHDDVPWTDHVLFVVSVCGVYLAGFFWLVARPAEVVVGYKG